MTITNTVLRRGPARFTMVGKKLPDSLHDTDEQIKPGTVKRLYNYALREITGAGFAVAEWDCEVYTMDADEAPEDRAYCVEFTNEMGGMIGLQGILVHRGWPTVDHGLTIDCGRRS